MTYFIYTAPYVGICWIGNLSLVLSTDFLHQMFEILLSIIEVYYIRESLYINNNIGGEYGEISICIHFMS